MPGKEAPMNAPDKLDTKFADLLGLTRAPFPASQKVFAHGERHADLRVPMREVQLTNDVRRGLDALRAPWIEARADTETYQGRERQALDDGEKHEAREAARLAALRAEAAALQRTPRRARSGGNVTQMHYARRGIVTPEM